MKAISVKEPYAGLIWIGDKTIETRTWQTDYRGPILFCASKNPKSQLAGHAFVIAELYKIEPMKKEHEKQACCKIYSGAFSWFLKDIEKLPQLVPVKGHLGLFEVNYEINKKTM